MTVEDLAIAILFELGASYRDSQLLNRGSFINRVVDGEDDGWCPGGRIITTSVYVGGPQVREHRDELKQMVGEAWDYLRQQGYITPDTTQGRNTDFVVLSPRGREVIARGRPKALDWSRAVAALNHPLHERLQAVGVDTTFRAGRVDVAIRDAFRDIEHCVREMSGLQVASPVPLMDQAFAANAGPLADHAAPKPQQHALQRLFMGAFGVYRNAPNHTYTSYGPGEAVEIILFSSLLLRELDNVGARVGRPLAGVSAPPV